MNSDPVMKQRLIVVGLIILLLISLIIIFFALSRAFSSPENTQQNPNIPTPTTFPNSSGNRSGQPISPLQKTVIDQTTDEEIQNNYEVLNMQTLENGNNLYETASELIPRPEKIITSNGVAVFESILTPENPNERGFTTLSSIVDEYGQPQSTLRGSNFYGWYIEHRIYSRQGFTVIGNPNTDEAYEIHAYQPMNTQEYIDNYGEDINTSLGPHTETY